MTTGATTNSRDRRLPQLMGIVNVTPDSFSDGGEFHSVESAIAHALTLEGEGASIIDIGGESTRPGAEPVGEDEEVARILPVIEGLRGRTRARISVDTRKPAVAKRAMRAGATLWNDVSALSFDEESLQAAAELGCDIVLMHSRGDPKTMQVAPRYANVVDEVFDYLHARIDACEAVGISRQRLIIDPGIGFGKLLEHNLALLSGLTRLHDLGCPLLVGVSRKRFIAALDREGPPAERIGGSIAGALAAAAAGARYLRVHDVAETRQALAVASALGG